MLKGTLTVLGGGTGFGLCGSRTYAPTDPAGVLEDCLAFRPQRAWPVFSLDAPWQLTPSRWFIYRLFDCERSPMASPASLTEDLGPKRIGSAWMSSKYSLGRLSIEGVLDNIPCGTHAFDLSPFLTGLWESAC